jgi:hypothetical protein
MFTISFISVIGVLLLYAALFLVIRGYKSNIEPEEKKTAVIVGLSWAILVFIGNYLFYLIGIMSFLPWINNFMHTFLWIGICLTWLYLGVRDTQPGYIQFTYFATFSFIVKYTEQMLFGTWEHGHFFFIFKGNFAYVLGWSLADGLYPAITNFGLKMVSKWVPGVVTVS